MKKAFLIAGIMILFTSCQRKQPLTAEEKMLCGHWMTSEGDHNRERYVFKHDGTFNDVYNIGFIGNYHTGETWEINNKKLTLTYKNTFFIIPFRSTPGYNILTLNDSTLVLATRATKRHPAIITSFKKMKLHGKFISA